MFYIDTRVIAASAVHQVHAQRHEVMFRDGSTVVLHPVALAAAPTTADTFLRAFHHEGLRWVIVDLRKIGGPELELDVLRSLPRDTPGLIFYTLRGRYRTAADCIGAIQQHATATWWPAAAAAGAEQQQQVAA